MCSERAVNYRVPVRTLLLALTNMIKPLPMIVYNFENQLGNIKSLFAICTLPNGEIDLWTTQTIGLVYLRIQHLKQFGFMIANCPLAKTFHQSYKVKCIQNMVPLIHLSVCDISRNKTIHKEVNSIIIKYL